MRCQEPGVSEHWYVLPRSPTKKEKNKNHCFLLVINPISALQETAGITSLVLYIFCDIKPLLFLQINQTNRRPLSISLWSAEEMLTTITLQRLYFTLYSGNDKMKAAYVPPGGKLTDSSLAFQYITTTEEGRQPYKRPDIFKRNTRQPHLFCFPANDFSLDKSSVAEHFGVYILWTTFATYFARSS